MRGRAWRIALLLFEALWLNAIVPGHQRGVVATPGEACQACEAPAAAAAVTCDMGGCEHRADPARRPVPVDPADHCAICHFAAMLSLPPAIDLTAPALRLLDVLPVPRGDASISLPAFILYDGRAPPGASFHLA